MSTWQIFSHAGTSFRWEASPPILPTKPADDPNGAPVPPLPSMADLLLQGCSKLIENGDGEFEKYPMFRTGLGKSVALKESSIAKALSILANDDAASTVTSSKLIPANNSCGNSLFQTGSGKMVNISSAGLVRAKTLLGLEHDNENYNFEGFQHPRRLPASNEPYDCQRFSHSGKKEDLQNYGVMDVTSEPRHMLNSRNGFVGGELGSENDSTPMHSKMFDSAPKPPPIKFHTAGGRSLSVSSDALKRARSLLGDPELGNFFSEMDQEVPPFTVYKEENFNDASLNKENCFFTSFPVSKDTSKDFTSPLKSSFKQTRSIFNSENLRFGSNLIEKFDAVESSSACASAINMPSPQNALNSINRLSEKSFATNNSLPSGSGSQTNLPRRSFGGPLADISNNIATSQTNNKQVMNEKRRIGRSSFVSPFKRPRCSKISAPLNNDVSLVANDDHTCCKITVSTKYPFRVPRVYIKEYFAVPPSACSTCFPIKGKQITPENAYEYLFKDETGLCRIGAEAFYDMLSHSGASVQHVSKEWVANHYKWIVWKLACYERCYPSKCAGKFLTVSNILEELKYRYEREVNHGQRSAIKKILEGDASPSKMLVLCVSTIQSNSEPNMETNLEITNGTHNSGNAKVELTDGWYSINAILDVLLSKQLAVGKLFVGQKLRIWGAGLCGWVGPVSPLEASSAISLALNMNGTFRAHWADRLGFCKGFRIPMAFRCIKGDGGPVPLTLVGVTRIYPVLYRERLRNGGSIVRSERMESRIVQKHNQRCSVLVDHVISEYQRGVNSSHIHNDSESEGAKILRILETSAEPEVLMAEMSPEQLTSFATYKSKLEATRQLEMEKSIEKALAEAGLNERDVVPFMRVRVVGLINRNYHGKGRPKEGIITIWNPTEKQESELVEGQAYVVSGLIPMNSDSEILYLQARGSTNKWQPLSPLAMESFEAFFCPRKSMKLSNLGEISLSSFCSPSIDDDSFAPINSNLVGSMSDPNTKSFQVGFCNLIKKPKDQMNHLWVAEATENSTYYLNFKPSISHLKSAGASVQAWAKASSSVRTVKHRSDTTEFIP
ncbi:protein BREAST CANCER SUSCEPTIBILITY 2-like protein B-like isoform X1 [Gossypium australe]|uniref:Protein BREAST CANCER SUSCEPTIBILITY 2-like protein B-like isoform X1 n=1 Tax=Gossypium australe TaxID=47621 RepID=A0A5B6V3W4_9ROSI|nr:protein BREAST CANCER SUSCEPTIBILITY 2-like protein B-like isoform X1 [Gossypium australe]